MASLLEELAAAARADPGFADSLLAAESTAELRLDDDELRELLGELTLDDIEHPALREMFSSASAQNYNVLVVDF
ncbi:MAG: hypothetical protein AAGF73_14615 [Actinomycetota bacterium]